MDSQSLDTDILGPPYSVEIMVLPPDHEGAVEANLVRRPAEQPTGRAVLHVHGFADYFFHTEYADWWAARGYDFYAVDLRKFGRSLREHQTPNFVADLREYFVDLDEAWTRITERDGHTEVVVSAHSTGGLTASLWAHERQPEQLAAMVLNSPWLDLHGPLWLRTIGTGVIKQVGARRPHRELRRTVAGHYGRSLHRDHQGEWNYNLAWKPLESWPVYAGWLRAIRLGHSQVHRGLDLGCPVLVLTSRRTARPAEMSDEVHRADIVLDVDQIRRWAPNLAAHVTLVAVDGARHDVVLSLPEVRTRVYAELERWLGAYLPSR